MASIPKYAEVSFNLLKLFNSDWGESSMNDFIKNLRQQNILTKDELKLCDAICEQVEIVNQVDVRMALKSCDLNYSFNPDNKFRTEDVLYESEDFINRRIQSMENIRGKNAWTSAGNGYFNKKNTAAFLNNYAKVISVDKTSKLSDFVSAFSEDVKVPSITSANDKIDKILKGGLKAGTITTILGSSTEQMKSLWSMNIAYQSLRTKKNVVYFSIGISEREFNKRLILRHSFELDFEKELFSSDEILELYSKEDVEKVCKDFYENYSNNLIVYDESYFDICSVGNIQKLLVVADYKFKEETNHGIDIIVIDDFSNLKLENKGKLITSRNQVQNEYYSYFRNQCKNLLGTGRMVPIVLVNTFDRNKEILYIENDIISRSMIPELIENMSENVFIINNESMDLARIAIVKPVRFADGSNFKEDIAIHLPNWYLSSGDDCLIEQRKNPFDDEESSEGVIVPIVNNSTNEITNDDPFGPENE